MRTIGIRTRWQAASAVALTIAAAAPLAAQSAGDFSAYNALVLTTTGGLPPLALPAMLTGPARPHLALRGGRISPWGGDDDRFTSIAAMVAVPVGARGAVGFTAGSLQSNCDRCDAQLMLGASASGRALSYPLGASPEGASFVVSLQAEVGWTRLDSGIGNLDMVSASAGVPLALVSGRSARQAALFLIPALGSGSVSLDGESESGMRPLLGGGAALGAGAVTLNLGFQKVFIEHGRTLVGAGLALRL